MTMRADSPKSRPYALRFMLRMLALGLALTALLAGPAQAAELRVVVVPDLELADLAALSRDGAVGLLVPDAGPETSEARALAALERGAVSNSLLGDEPPGDRRIEAVVARNVPNARVIVLALPRGGEQPNDRRYPIAVLAPGYRGLLTSPSTRIPGLVSIVDVAPTALDEDDALGSEQENDPVEALAALEDRIVEHRDAKTPILLVSLALLVAVAVFRREAVLPAFAAVLLGNLVLGITGWTEVWAAVVVAGLVAGAALVAPRDPLAQGLPLVGVLAAYLVAMGIDERWVALSPLGPTQNARFYGLSNLLATLLLVPALGGAAILGRRFGLWAFGAVAALALVTVGGSAFGADGGGVLVLLAGFAVLLVLQYPVERRTLLIAAGFVAGVLAAALVLGGHSHVTDALADGPVGLAEDFARRIELSWLRATSGWGVALLVFGGILVLAAFAFRERRPLMLAYLVALDVSLLVNDSPNDVIVAGLAGYLALSSAPGVARPASERATPAPRGPRAQSAQPASL